MLFILVELTQIYQILYRLQIMHIIIKAITNNWKLLRLSELELQQRINLLNQYQLFFHLSIDLDCTLLSLITLLICIFFKEKLIFSLFIYLLWFIVVLGF